MTATIVVISYLAIGLATLVFAWFRLPRPGFLAAVVSLLCALLLWPYVLPYLFNRTGEGGTEAPRGGSRLAEIDHSERRLAEALAQARSVDTGSPRVGQVAARYCDQLRRLDTRLGTLRGATHTAPESVRDQLQQMLEDRSAELNEGLRLMEELAGRLTVLAFSEPGEAGAGRDELAEIQGLLDRLEAQASATREVEAVGA